MPWNMQDYPDSLKNLPTLVRKKAIDILNALLQEGYSEGRAIPIATSQAEKWADHASKKEKDEFEKEENPKKTDKHENQHANIDLVDNDVEIYYEEKEWKVKTKGAKRPTQTFSTKEDAIERGKEVAHNKQSTLVVYKMDGSTDRKINP